MVGAKLKSITAKLELIMPRNPQGTPAVQALIAALKERGVETTPRQIEQRWKDGLAPIVTGAEPPTDDVIEHYAALLPLFTQGRSSHLAALIMTVRGYPVSDDAFTQSALRLFNGASMGGFQNPTKTSTT